MLSLYQPPINRSSRHVQGNFTHHVNYRYCCHVPGLVFIAGVEGLSSQARAKAKFLKIAYFLENYSGTDYYVVISEVDVLTYVVINEAEKRVLYGELIGTTKCITL